MSDIEIRIALDKDVPAITEIYNEAIRNTTATFDMVEKTIEDRRKWLAEHDEKSLVIIAEVNGIVAGWGSLAPYGERPGWRFTVENAVYVSPEFQGLGIGRRLLEELVRLAELLGYHAIIAQVVGGNEASIKLHEKCRFETVGVMKAVGNKFDRWLDVIVMEKMLSPGVVGQESED